MVHDIANQSVAKAQSSAPFTVLDIDCLSSGRALCNLLCTIYQEISINLSLMIKLKPPKTKPHRYFSKFYSVQPLVDKELDKLVQDGVIESVHFADWVTPIVHVLKSNKSSVRICGDIKVTLNRVSKLDCYPIPKIEDLFTKLVGGQRFSQLDMSQAQCVK